MLIQYASPLTLAELADVKDVAAIWLRQLERESNQSAAKGETL
jgi:hypothetical protein